VRTQLELLSDAIDARRAIALRERSAPFRVFLRQIGVDPDVERTMLESVLIERMRDGAFLSRGLPADACTIAALETGVPVWAIDADRVVGRLGITVTEPDESLAVADARGPLTALMADPGPELEPGRNTAAVALFSVAVPGALKMIVDEALWIAANVASEPR
jgi:hypothetical protein